MFAFLQRYIISSTIHSGPHSYRITDYKVLLFNNLTAHHRFDLTLILSTPWRVDCPVTQDRPETHVNEGYTKLHSDQEICQPKSSSLTNDGSPAVNQQTKQRAGCWELIVSPQQVPPTPPSPKYLKRWHCGALLVCSWWPVRSVSCEWAGVEAGGLDSNMQWH